jgi:hypothetical protein
MTEREKAAFLAGISFTAEKFKATGPDSRTGDFLFVEANRALNFQEKLLALEVMAEIEKALESGGFSWPPEVSAD